MCLSIKILVEKLKTDQLLFGLVFVFGVLGIYFRLETLDSVFINQWVTRDFDRALNLIEGNYIPLAGPEMNSGGRLPGPFLYFLLAVPLLLDPSYGSLFNFNFLLNIGSLVGFFWLVKKYVDLRVSVLATILLSINLPYIGSVGFPINPSFLFPFIVLFIWFLFEFTLNDNQKFLPLIVLVISLGMQLHFSIATYFLVTLVAVILFKIRVSAKIIMASILVAILCFTPYMAYQRTTFVPFEEGSKTLEWNKDSSLKDFLKIPFMLDTLDRLTYKNGIRRYQQFPDKMAALYYPLTALSLGCLFIFILLQTKKKGLLGCRKEMVFLILFYVPALIYEVVHPMSETKWPHNWYTYIFLMPQALIIAWALTYIIEKAKPFFLRVGLFGLTSIMVVYLSYSGYQEIQKSNQKVTKDFKIWDFKNTGLLYKTLFETFGLSPVSLMKKVYIEDFRPPPISKHLLNISFQKSNKASLINGLNDFGDCLYLVDYILFSGRKTGSFQASRMELFFDDKSVEILDSGQFDFAKYKIKKKKYFYYIYKLQDNQSCYSNSFNPFVVDFKTRELLLQSKGLNGNSDIDVKVVSLKERYDSQSDLISFSGNYLFYSKVLNSPFRFILNLHKNDSSYILTSQLEQFYYWPFENILRNMDILFCQAPDLFNTKNCKRVSILKRGSLASNIMTYSQNLTKKTALPDNLKIKKNKTSFYLAWLGGKVAKTFRSGAFSNISQESIYPLNGRQLEYWRGLRSDNS